MVEPVRPDPPAEGPTGDPASDGARKRRPRNAEKTRQDILQAAGRRFARSGYSHVTLKDIADDVGVTPALIVHYFGSKHRVFEAVAKAGELDFPPFDDGARDEQLTARARIALDYYEDDTTHSGVALLRSLDLDGGELFRSELERRIRSQWSSRVTGPGAEIRLKLIAGILMGVGMFSLGGLTEPDRPPLSDADAEYVVHYLAELLGVCVDP